jgi:cobalt-zinc-cadmium efflux system protein
MSSQSGHAGEKNIRLAFFLNLAFTIAEFAGGLYTNSLAITADALHDLGDSFSLGLAWFFERISGRKPTAIYSYGYRRFSLAAALINGVVLLVGSSLIIWSALDRLAAPVMPNAPGMLVFAVVGVLVNGIAALRVKTGKSLNEQMVAWHLIEDVLGWIAVLFVSFVLMFRNVPVLDPILSILITFIVLGNVLRNLRKTMVIFLQGVPPTVSLRNVEAALRKVPGVAGLHDLHLWSLDGEHHILTGHIVVPGGCPLEELVAVKCRVKEKALELGISHATIEIEHQGESCTLLEETLD